MYFKCSSLKIHEYYKIFVKNARYSLGSCHQSQKQVQGVRSFNHPRLKTGSSTIANRQSTILPCLSRSSGRWYWDEIFTPFNLFFCLTGAEGQFTPPLPSETVVAVVSPG